MFALHLKTRNSRWHVFGQNFRDYRLLLDEQAGQMFATTDVVAGGVRKLGGTTIRAVSDISRLQRIVDNCADCVAPEDMLGERLDDNPLVASHLRGFHDLYGGRGDIATESMIETWVD
jgi:starvation-inducible DNA-binding protein